jgi:hypothetical protein
MISPLFNSSMSTRLLRAVAALPFALCLAFSGVQAEEPDASLGPPPGQYHLTSASGEVRIPFEI